MLLGWATNCLPAALPARFALVVAAYSEEDNDFIAASGRYRSPVLLEGLPLLVAHFWAVQSLSDCWGFLITIPATRSLVAFSHNLCLPRAPLPCARTYNRRSLDAIEDALTQTRLGVVTCLIYLAAPFKHLNRLVPISLLDELRHL